MELFNIQTTELTKEQKLEDLKEQIKRQSFMAILSLKNQQKHLFGMIWNHGTFTPQEILDSFGTSAVELFVVSKNIEDLLEAALPNYERLVVPYEYTINQDGTVTVGNKKE